MGYMQNILHFEGKLEGIGGVHNIEGSVFELLWHRPVPIPELLSSRLFLFWG